MHKSSSQLNFFSEVDSCRQCVSDSANIEATADTVISMPAAEVSITLTSCTVTAPSAVLTTSNMRSVDEGIETVSEPDTDAQTSTCNSTQLVEQRTLISLPNIEVEPLLTWTAPEVISAASTPNDPVNDEKTTGMDCQGSAMSWEVDVSDLVSSSNKKKRPSSGIVNLALFPCIYIFIFLYM